MLPPPAPFRGSGDPLSKPERAFPRRALHLGTRGWGRVAPNPMVGCVIVQGDRIVGEGWHREYGESHAEVNALREAGARAAGSTAFVSLEPCDHHGRTPPCSEALLAAGVRRVVFAAADPGPGKGGAAHLRARGVELSGPHLTPSEAALWNPGFLAAQSGQPHLALKLATSLDGGIAARVGERTAITGPVANGWVQDLRAGFDAILVGGETARIDDPLLTARGRIEARRPPRRIVVSTGARLAPAARLLTAGDPPLLLVGERAPESRVRALRHAGAEIVRLPEKDGRIDPGVLLAHLGECGFHTVLCEGGAALGSALLRAGAVSRFLHLTAPLLLGEGAVPAFRGRSGRDPFPEEGDVGEGSEPVPGSRPSAGWVVTGGGLLGPDLLTVWDRSPGSGPIG